jgi:hypothetical protein
MLLRTLRISAKVKLRLLPLARVLIPRLVRPLKLAGVKELFSVSVGLRGVLLGFFRRLPRLLNLSLQMLGSGLLSARLQASESGQASDGEDENESEDGESLQPAIGAPQLADQDVCL